MNRRLLNAQVTPEGSLADAMRALDESTLGIALVVDGEGCLMGTLTDGDIRRALLGGASLSAALIDFMRLGFTSVSPQAHRAEVLDLMTSCQVAQVPIIDGDGRLVGLHLLREIVGAHERPNWAVVMAGGQGMRLRPLTAAVPKPMLKVAGRPILERIVLQLVGHGFRRIFLSVNYLGHLVEAHFGDGSQYGCRIEYLRETEPLDTAGALSLLPEMPTDPVIVMNGDLVTQADLGGLLDFHALRGFMATVGIRRYVHTVPFGCVELEGERIQRFEEKPQLDRLINTGMYALAPALVARVQGACSIPSLLDGCLSRQEPVGAYEVEEDWVDIGQLEQLHAARGGGAGE